MKNIIVIVLLSFSCASYAQVSDIFSGEKVNETNWKEKSQIWFGIIKTQKYDTNRVLRENCINDDQITYKKIIVKRFDEKGRIIFEEESTHWYDCSRLPYRNDTADVGIKITYRYFHNDSYQKVVYSFEHNSKKQYCFGEIYFCVGNTCRKSLHTIECK